MENQDEDFTDKVDNYNREVEVLHKEIARKDELIKTLNEDYENERKMVESLKKDHNILKSDLQKEIAENKELRQRLIEAEKDRKVTK